MTAASIISYIRFDPSMEVPEQDEAQTAAELVTTMRGICETTYKDGGHAIRSVHAKSHAILKGELTILPNLPTPYANGLFAKPGTHPVVMRFSTTPGDILDDSVSTPRGLAIKILNVDGERLPGSDGRNQDFLMVNGPAFQAASAKDFLKSLKLLAATTDRVPGIKKIASALLRAAEATLESVGGESATLKSLGGHPETNVLGETFFTEVPVLYGPYIAKLSLAPVSPDLATLKNAPVDLRNKPNGLREAAADFFRSHDAEWELRVQLCTNLEDMPIEDSSKPWPEDKSPYVPVARIRVAAQDSWSEARSRAVDDGFSFSPWHGIADHRPLGSIMRVRKAAYDMSAKFRSDRNAVHVCEPSTIDDVLK
jgi:hypothetical protein